MPWRVAMRLNSPISKGIMNTGEIMLLLFDAKRAQSII
jgi:hypothetical protein